MRALCFIAVLVFGLVGCSRRDPFDRVMDYVSHESVSSYLFSAVELSATATPEQLISALKSRGDFGSWQIATGSVRILETRSVHTEPPISQAYTAVWIDTNLGHKMVLFQPLSSKGKWDGWYWKIYDI
jgi:hypothetical protein